MQLWDQLTNAVEMLLGTYPMATLLLAGDFHARLGEQTNQSSETEFRLNLS